MSLRVRTLLVVLATLVLSTGLLYMGVRWLLLYETSTLSDRVHAGFLEVEQRQAERNAHRVRDALRMDVDNLDIKLVDWSNWDDSYRFMKDHNRKFPASNIRAGTLQSLRLHMLAFVDESARAVHVAVIDGRGDTTQIPAAYQTLLGRGGGLLCRFPSDSFKGLVPADSSILVVASRPVLTTDGDGPVRGTAVFLYQLDSSRLSEIEHLTHLQVRVEPLAKADAEVASALQHSDPETVLVDSSRADTLRIHTIVDDVQGRPSILLSVGMPREIIYQGQVTLNEMDSLVKDSLDTIAGALMVLGLLLALFVSYTLERLVLRRVSKLSVAAREVAESSDFTRRIGGHGADEIGHLAKALDGMLDALEQAYAGLERAGASRKHLLEHVPIGIFTIGDDFRIQPGSSRVAASVLCSTGSPLDGVHLKQALGLSDLDWERLQEFLDVFRLGLLPDADMPALNPFPVMEACVGGQSHHLRSSWVPMGEPLGTPRDMLCILEDISGEHSLEEELHTVRSEVAFLKSAVGEPRSLALFLRETEMVLGFVRRDLPGILDEYRSDPSAELDQSGIDQLFRMVHGISGMAGSFGLAAIAESSRHLEASLAWLRDGSPPAASSGPSARGSGPEDEYRIGISGLQAALAVAQQMSKQYLRMDPDHPEFPVPETLLLRLLQFKDSPDPRLTEILPQIAACRNVPVGQAFRVLIPETGRIAETLGKRAVLVIEGVETRLEPSLADNLQIPLLHLLRNALAHGIESPEARTAFGKNPKGRIRLRIVYIADGSLEVEMSDDGQGVDRQRILDLAIASGLVDGSVQSGSGLDDEALRTILFHPGFTSKAEVDSVSGRGVGLDAVGQMVQELGGTIQVKSEKGKGTSFLIHLPMHSPAI